MPTKTRRTTQLDAKTARAVRAALAAEVTALDREAAAREVNRRPMTPTAHARLGVLTNKARLTRAERAELDALEERALADAERRELAGNPRLEDARKMTFLDRRRSRIILAQRWKIERTAPDAARGSATRAGGSKGGKAKGGTVKKHPAYAAAFEDFARQVSEGVKPYTAADAVRRKHGLPFSTRRIAQNMQEDCPKHPAQ